MNVRVFPTTRLEGDIVLPASKSYSVRAFMIAACGGRSRIGSPSLCDDALAAAMVAKKLGARISRHGQEWDIAANAAREDLKCIDVKESGTVLRMLLPLVALRDQPARVIGQGTLKGRPNHHLVQTLQQLGVAVSGVGKKHSVPIDFSGGQLSGGTVVIDGSLSSQFISALLMVCPQLPQDSTLKISGPKMVSTDYITMTLQVLKAAGIRIDRRSSRCFKIPGGQVYKGLRSFSVPSDYGLAAFLMAAAALVPSKVTLKGVLGDKFIQADGRILPILQRMGVVFRKTSRSLRLSGPFQIKGGVFSLKDCPDLLPILSVLALFADRPVKFTHIEHVRAKESDRISDLAHELRKIGASLDEGRDFLTVQPRSPQEYRQNVTVNPYSDHRLAMAFAVLGLRTGIQVKDMECVAKSYPDFFRDLKALGGKIQKQSR